MWVNKDWGVGCEFAGEVEIEGDVGGVGTEVFFDLDEGVCCC